MCAKVNGVNFVSCVRYSAYGTFSIFYVHLAPNVLLCCKYGVMYSL